MAVVDARITSSPYLSATTKVLSDHYSYYYCLHLLSLSATGCKVSKDAGDR